MALLDALTITPAIRGTGLITGALRITPVIQDQCQLGYTIGPTIAVPDIGRAMCITFGGRVIGLTGTGRESGSAVITLYGGTKGNLGILTTPSAAVHFRSLLAMPRTAVVH